jgi:hypothetical protein
MDMVYLVGASDVREAGHNIRSAADDIGKAASNMDSTFLHLRQYLDELISRFEVSTNKFVEAVERLEKLQNGVTS